MAQDLETLISLIHKVSDALRKDEVRGNDDDRASGELTPSEKKVLIFLARGFHCSFIASHLHNSPETIKKHKARIREKTGKCRPIDLAKYAIRQGWLDPVRWANESASSFDPQDKID